MTWLKTDRSKSMLALQFCKSARNLASLSNGGYYRT
jgi:hypothetical protein